VAPSIKFHAAAASARAISSTTIIDVIGSISRPSSAFGMYIRNSRASCIAASTFAGSRRSRSPSSRQAHTSGIMRCATLISAVSIGAPG